MGAAEKKQQIVRLITGMSGRYSPFDVFSDWIMMAAISIQNMCCMNRGKVWQDREQRWLDTAKKYTDIEMDRFAEMTAYLTEALEDRYSDVLGEVYMEAGLGNKYTGQFFTPFRLSELCARIGISADELPKQGRIRIYEPTCGGGGMVIAACKVLRDQGFDFQRKLDVVAQDLDWKGVYMSYVQLSLIGCRAVVVQGDTLVEPFDARAADPSHVMRTPAYLGMLI